MDALASFDEPVANHNTRERVSKTWPKPDGSKAKTAVHREQNSVPYPTLFLFEKCHLFLIKRPLQEDTVLISWQQLLFIPHGIFFSQVFFRVAWSSCSLLSSHSKFSNSCMHVVR